MVVLHALPHDDFAAGLAPPEGATEVASGRIRIGRPERARRRRRPRRRCEQDAGCQRRKQQGRLHGNSIIWAKRNHRTHSITADRSSGHCESGEEAAAQEHIDDVARYLTRHRISGGPRIIIHQEGSGAAQLVRLAQDEGADLIVAGAYGHSRLGEWMFGGMTRDLLATSPICCLMSH
jgi:hypothetical protein